MKVFMCVLVVVAAATSAVSTSPPASQTAQASPATQSASSSSSSSQVGTPSQVANKRGDTDFATSASQQQPVYSPSISQQPSAHSQSASPSDYQSTASNGNLYYYYYPASGVGAGKSESAGSDPYQASAASSYPTYSSDGASHVSQHSGYEGPSSSYGSSAYQSQLQQAYAHQPHGGSPSYQYGGALLPSDSQLSAQYASGSGAPVSGYQGQAPGYPSQGGYQTAQSTFQPTYAPAADSKSRFYGLGSVIMPLVGLGALAFLLPSVTNLGGKKKTKRSVDNKDSPSKANGVAEYAERLEKYFKIYRAAVENDDCMNRIVCELGDSVSGVNGKAPILALFEKVAPQWMAGKMGVFKFGALTDKSAKCARYKC